MDEDQKALQRRITQQWQAFATKLGREAYEDLMKYIDSQRELYRQYGEELSMPHPNKPGERIIISPDTCAILLQNGRGMNIVKTYITSRVESGVVQSKSK